MNTHSCFRGVATLIQKALDLHSILTGFEIRFFRMKFDIFCLRFHVVYSGTGVSHKVSKLSENRTYKFRLCASNEAGQGPFSNTYEFKTAYAHPPAIKGKVLKLKLPTAGLGLLNFQTATLHFSLSTSSCSPCHRYH